MKQLSLVADDKAISMANGSSFDLRDTVPASLLRRGGTGKGRGGEGGFDVSAKRATQRRAPCVARFRQVTARHDNKLEVENCNINLRFRVGLRAHLAKRSIADYINASCAFVRPRRAEGQCAADVDSPPAWAALRVETCFARRDAFCLTGPPSSHLLVSVQAVRSEM